MQVKATPKSYDVVIVGSGAGGGIAAHILALGGAKICMLEAGGFYDCAKQSDMFKWDYNAPHRAAGTREKPFGYYDDTLEGGWQVPGEPYTSAPGSDFLWYRARMLGGRTNHYGRISLRMGPYDFKPYSRDGMVRGVLVGPDGMATGVSYIDRKTRQEIGVKASVVVLAASCCETARILLNSKNSHFPDGVANSTGLVGKYIMDTVGASVSGYLPILEDLPPQNEDGVGGMHLYMPWWQYQEQKAGKLPFARGYHIEIGGGRGLPGAGVLSGSERIRGGGYGGELKRHLRKMEGANVHLRGRGEKMSKGTLSRE